MMIASLWAFIAISLFVICTPGPDTVLTIRNTLVGGRGASVATALGVATGQTVWALGTGLGLVAILLASELVFQTIKLMGAAYLIWLGVQTIARAFRDRAGVAAELAKPGPRLERGRAYRQGLFSNLGNPKMAAFFASVMPQFAPQDEHMFTAVMLLGALFVAMTFAWLMLYSVATIAISGFMQRSRIGRAIDGAMGALLIPFGLKLATER